MGLTNFTVEIIEGDVSTVEVVPQPTIVTELLEIIEGDVSTVEVVPQPTIVTELLEISGVPGDYVPAGSAVPPEGSTGQVLGKLSDGKYDTGWVDKANVGDNSDITALSGISGGISSPDYIQFDTNAVITSAEGKLFWDNADGNKTLAFGMTGDTVQQIGEEIYYRIKATSAIKNGQVVMLTGSVGNSGALTGAPASGLGLSEGIRILGIATEDINANSWGYVTWFGLVRNINTSGSLYGEVWNDGDGLYWNPAIPGGLTKNIPSAPNPKVRLCRVINSSKNGSLHVRPTYGSVLGSTDSNVEFGDLTNGDMIVYNSTSARWENYTISQIKETLGLQNVTNESKEQLFTDSVLTGVPTAPTAPMGTSTSQIATTAFVSAEIDTCSKFHYHDQPVPSDTWVINHNLNRYPNATVVDSAGSQVIGDVTYLSNNSLVITFSGAFSGKVYLN